MGLSQAHSSNAHRIGFLSLEGWLGMNGWKMMLKFLEGPEDFRCLLLGQMKTSKPLSGYYNRGEVFVGELVSDPGKSSTRQQE